MSRRKAREYALMFLYQLEIRGGEAREPRELFLEEYSLEGDGLAYFDDLCQGVLEDREGLDKVYEPFLKGWSVDRLPKIDVVLLRIAVYEIAKTRDIPKKVAINEAVILAKKYGTDESKAYINGILGKIPESPKNESNI